MENSYSCIGISGVLSSVVAGSQTPLRPCRLYKTGVSLYHRDSTFLVSARRWGLYEKWLSRGLCTLEELLRNLRQV